MYPHDQKMTREDCLREVQDLEDAYAEALADGTDARSLSLLWERIKTVKSRMEEETSK